MTDDEGERSVIEMIILLKIGVQNDAGCDRTLKGLRIGKIEFISFSSRSKKLNAVFF